MLMSSKIQMICKTKYVFIRKWQMPCNNTSGINPLMPGSNKKVTHTLNKPAGFSFYPKSNDRSIGHVLSKRRG